MNNCVASLETKQEVEEFQRSATEIMEEAKMNLRGWECSFDDTSREEPLTKVLGIVWNIREDILKCEFPENVSLLSRLTKRLVLSVVHRIFDSLGFCAPVLVAPKLLLQRSWDLKIGWDAPLPESMAFKEGREEVADEPRSGRPTTARTDENVDRVLEVLRTDRRLSIQQIADTLHMSTFVEHGIVTEDLKMRKVCAKFVPKVLTQDQKELRVLRCQELLDLIQNEPGFLNSVVTGDESWMFEYDQESKRQSCAWHKKSSPRPKKTRMSKSRIKTMIIVFFDIRGIVHCAQEIETPDRTREDDIKDTVKLYHDNDTSHTAFIITNFLARSNTPVIPHPPYSLDLAPCDFFLFPRLKREMKGKHWETVENIQHHVTTFLRSIPVEEFHGAFQAWQTRLRNDASQVAYGAVAYLWSEVDGICNTTLIWSKARLAPIKRITIPRMELMAMILESRLANSIHNALKRKCKITLWSDSFTALSWTKRDIEWRVFVRNRIKEIQCTTNLNDWRFIPGHLNPADLLSRGCSPCQFVRSRWWEGPGWLKEPKELWPKSEPTRDQQEVCSEEKIRHLKIGDIVLIGLENIKRMFWPKGRIVELISGKDGIARVAHVKTSTGVIVRAIQRLYPLDISSNEGKDQSDKLSLCPKSDILRRGPETLPGNYKS
ncbi:hypothetical protein LAZ67_2005414, partial [Cordylochernes scorpioides]